MDSKLLKKIVEGALLAAGQPLTVARIASLFDAKEEGELELVSNADDKPSKEEIQAALEDIQADTRGRGFELKEVGSGWRFQVVQETAPWISRLWEEKPQKYSRALLETLALIAYRQPITRGEIESIRGVAVSSHIIKTLTEREWVKVVGHRDVPGRPALYATTKQFLDYFNMRSLDELPSLKEIREIDKIESELDFGLQEQISGAQIGDVAQAMADVEGDGAPNSEAPDSETPEVEASADADSEEKVESEAEQNLSSEESAEAGELAGADESTQEAPIDETSHENQALENEAPEEEAPEELALENQAASDEFADDESQDVSDDDSLALEDEKLS